MNKNQFRNALRKANDNGTLMTAKHNPSNLSLTFSNYRTVLSYDLADDLEHFLMSEDYEVKHYRNNNPYHSPDYYEIIPSGSKFSVPASGVDAFSPYPTGTCDRLVAVSGLKQGWHLFGEESAVIQRQVKKGALSFKGTLT